MLPWRAAGRFGGFALNNNDEEQQGREGAHFAAPADAPERPRADCEVLEGDAADAVCKEAAEREDLQGASATPAVPSVKRREVPRDRFESAFQSDLEPELQRRGNLGARLNGAEQGPRDEAPEQQEELVRHRHKVKKVPLAAKVFFALIAAIAVVAGGLMLWVNGVNSSMQLDAQSKEELEQVLDAAPAQGDQKENEAFYTLILGSDARSGDSVSRSDVIMLARVDADNGRVTLVSIPRDTMVTSLMGTTEKINGEFNYGPANSVKAVEEFAGVKISHYVQVDFDGLEKVVDALGGVWVDIPENIPSGNGGKSFAAGNQLLDGASALSYARERYNVSGGDFGRAQAQRQIVEAIANKVLEASPASVPGLVADLASSISTDLSVADIASYALKIQAAEGGMRVYSCATPSYSLAQGGVSYVATEYDEWRAMMQRVDAGLDPNDSSAQVPQAQADNENLGAATNAAGPRDYKELAANAALTTDDVASIQ